jgi:hypothetical protein
MADDRASFSADRLKLRRVAAEILGSSRWWYEEQLREELLSRAWHRARPRATQCRHGGDSEVGVPAAPGPVERTQEQASLISWLRRASPRDRPPGSDPG